jgi:hypothetical protein
MASLSQIEANRRNSQKSTGPRTASGKAASSQNACTTGLYAEAPIVEFEDPAALEALTASYEDTYRPANPDECALLDTLIHTDWLLRRMRRVETQAWNRQTDKLRNDSFYQFDPQYALIHTYNGIHDRLDRIQRRLSALERVYHRTLIDLRRLQAERLTVPAAAAPVPRAPAPNADPVPLPAVPQIGFVPSKTNFPPPDTAPGAPNSPTLGHFPQLRMSEKPSGAENCHRSPTHTTF